MFDPYHKWLGIPKHQRPPTYYQLLGVDPTEQDAEVIEEAAVRQTTHVRAYQIGPNAADCTRLLNEISLARQTLLNPAKRKAYDTQIGMTTKRAAPRETAQAITPAPPAPNAFADIADESATTPLYRPRDLRSVAIKKASRGWMLPVAISAGAAVVVLAIVAVLFFSRTTTPIAEGPKPKPPIERVGPGANPDPETPVKPVVEPRVPPPDNEVKPSPKKPPVEPKIPDSPPQTKKPPEPTPPEPPVVVRAPIPPEADRLAADKLLHERYAKELTKILPADRAALSEKFLKDAEAIKDSPADRYVLMAKAIDLAVLGAKPILAAKTVDEFARSFEIDAAKMKLSVLTALNKTAQAKASSKELGDTALAAAREAALADDWPLAMQFIAIAKLAAPRAVITGYVTLVQKQESSFQAAAKEFEAMRAAQQTLEADAADGPANAAVGRYLCLRHGDWDKGLPHLAKGGPDTLAPLAQEDLKNPTEAAPQAELADAWLTAADKENEWLKPALQQRALHWYRLALPQSNGLLQAKVTDRIKVLEALPSPFRVKEMMAELHRVKAHVGAVTSLELAPDGKTIFSGGLDGYVRGWDVANLRSVYGFPSKIPVHSFSFAPDGAYLAICSDTRIHLWDLNKVAAKPRRDMGSVAGAFWLHSGSIYRVQGQTFWSHDILTGQGGGRKVPAPSVHRTIVSPDKRAVAMLAPNEVLWIRMSEQAAIGTVSSFCRMEAVSGAFSPDHLLLALADKDNSIRIFDVETRQEIKSLTGHTGAVRCLAFASATRLVSGGDDKSVRVWHVGSGKEIARVVHAGPVTAIVASADGRIAFTGSADSTVRRWELPPDSK